MSFRLNDFLVLFAVECLKRCVDGWDNILQANENNSFDRMTAITQLKTQLNTVRGESNKFRSKWKLAVGALAKVQKSLISVLILSIPSKAQREFESDRKMLEKFILVPLSEEDFMVSVFYRITTGVNSRFPGSFRNMNIFSRIWTCLFFGIVLKEVKMEEKERTE